MLNGLLAIVGHDDGNYYFDNMAESLIYAIVGIFIVFAGIVILIGILYLIGFIFKKAEGKPFSLRKKKSAELSDENSLQAAEQEDIPDHVKAAAIAAVMAYCHTEKPKCEFTVKRIKRI